MSKANRWPGILVVVAAAMGLLFACYSTFDYAEHLDRQVHAIHCSFIPGAAPSNDESSPCRTAMYSPYAALFRTTYWGGVPISLFAVGAFCFFLAFGVYLLLAKERAPRLAHRFLAVLGCAPLAASLLMFFISLLRLGSFCRVCVGIYTSSALLAAGAYWNYRTVERERALAELTGRGQPLLPKSALPAWAMVVAWLSLLGAAAAAPAAAYVSSLPDYRPYLGNCGNLAEPTESHGSLLKLPSSQPVQPVIMFADPLCPTCKAFHERLVAEGIFERLDVTLALFPLDNDCNWMLDRPLHPGACTLAKAVLCGGAHARDVLEWSYKEQDDLRLLAKTGAGPLKARIVAKWGADVGSCMEQRTTAIKLNHHLQFAAQNHIPISTPQMFLGQKRLCDEDTDLGLRFTLAQLAPQTVP